MDMKNHIMDAKKIKYPLISSVPALPPMMQVMAASAVAAVIKYAAFGDFNATTPLHRYAVIINSQKFNVSTSR